MAVEKKRLQFIDAIKGIAILWVIMFHLIAPCGFKNVIAQLTDVFVASFFFYSGYFHKPGKRTFGENMKNRAKSLLIPFFRYSLCFWAVGSVYLVATKEETLEEAFLCLRNFFVGCIWNRTIQDWFGWEYYSLGKRYFYLADFWFLLALLFASILFFLIVDRVLKSGAVMVLTVIVLFAITGVCQHFSLSLPYNIQLVPYWTAYMILGAYAGQLNLAEFPPLSTGASSAVGVILVVIGIVISMLKAPASNVFRGSFGENEVLSMILCIAATVPFSFGIGILFARLEAAGVRMKELAWIGSHSLFLYLFHMFYAGIISVITGFSVQYKDPVSTGVVAGSFLLTAVCVVLCILRAMLDDKLKKPKTE
jgi:fucose 4-O-acetylase-like acetyltransferase